MNLRRQNENKFKEKEDMYKQKWEQIRMAQAQNAYNRDKAKAMRDGTRAGLLEQRQANVHNTRAQSQRLLIEKKEREAGERQDNANRSCFIKQRREDVKRRLE